MCGTNEGLSSRERNRAKRKARQAISKQRSKEPTEDICNNEEGDKKRIKLEEKVKDEANMSLGNSLF